MAYGGRVSDPAARLEIVRPAVPGDLGGTVLGQSWSNDTWLTSGSVLRVCWRGDRERLVREGMVLESLPDSVPLTVAKYTRSRVGRHTPAAPHSQSGQDSQRTP